jgi:hypothetical protein
LEAVLERYERYIHDEHFEPVRKFCSRKEVNAVVTPIRVPMGGLRSHMNAHKVYFGDTRSAKKVEDFITKFDLENGRSIKISRTKVTVIHSHNDYISKKHGSLTFYIPDKTLTKRFGLFVRKEREYLPNIYNHIYIRCGLEKIENTEARLNWENDLTAQGRVHYLVGYL